MTAAPPRSPALGHPPQAALSAHPDGSAGPGEARLVPDATPQSYYGHPVIKPPVWKPEIPLYLFAGGLAGASSILAATARRRGNDVLARRALLTSLAAVSASPVLLIADLGRPERFYNMLRVVKVTSPMNVGTWILSAFGTATGTAAACEVLGVLPGVRRVAEAAAAALGGPLSTYTAVLITDTAVPAWHQARLEMPVVFAASALTSAGGAALVLTPTRHAGPARALAVGGALGEFATSQLTERLLGEVGEPYRQGTAGRFMNAAKGLSAVGSLLVLAGGRRRPVAMVAGLTLMAGALCERWGIFHAGMQSARDPRFTVGPQRARLRH